MKRVAFVSGAGSGIGRACALRLVAEDAAIAIVDINKASADETAQMVEAQGGTAIALQADVSDAEAIETAVAKVVRHFQGLDWAINAAGAPPDPHAEDWQEDVWNRMISVNLLGVMHCMKHQLAQMRSAGGGSIVNIASIGGAIGIGTASYGASKQGVVGLTRVAAIGFAAENVRVNAICPGIIMTPMAKRAFEANPELLEAELRAVPMRRGGRPEEVAEAAVWLCSDRSSYITAQAITVDGGLTSV